MADERLKVEIVTNTDDDKHVNPAHYRDLGLYSALHVVEVWGLGFHLGQAIKYIQRAGRRSDQPEIRDLKKAIWYIQRYIHNLDPNEFDPADDANQPPIVP